MNFEQRTQAIKMPEGKYTPTLKDKIVDFLKARIVCFISIYTAKH
jgi:hypothetical protein